MIVITGGIGSGKSVVCRVLRNKGYGVYDCDFMAKILMTKNHDLKEGLITLLGKEIYSADHSLNRKRLAEIIFGDDFMRNKVDALVHSAVRKDIWKWMNLDKRNLFVETALAVESGITEDCEEIWEVESDENLRINRIKQRSGLSEERILRIMEVQKEQCSHLGFGFNVKKIKNTEGYSLILQIDTLLASIVPNK